MQTRRRGTGEKVGFLDSARNDIRGQFQRAAALSPDLRNFLSWCLIIADGNRAVQYCSRAIPMDGVIVIVAYRPKPGKEGELLDLVRSRVPTLRKEGLATDRAPIIMRARDGTIVEVSEWRSQKAIDAAHKNPNVLAMWNKFFAICDCVPFKTLAEAEEMFPNFEPL
jgi:quinol monooxygenase YgiN